MTTRADRYDIACAVVLAALTVVSRLPYRARMLYNWDAVHYLTVSMANYVTVVNPRVLVLGGGVIESVPALFTAAAAGIPPLTTILGREVLHIERASLGDWSGVVGAAALAHHSAR